MVKSFSFSRLPLIHFGQGKISLLPDIAAGLGQSALVVTGIRSFTASPAGERIFSALEAKGLRLHIITVEGEPSPAVIDDAVAEFPERKPDMVIAIGGGSAIDTGKAISAMLPLGERVRDYLEGVGTKEHPGIKVPFIAVPTTAGTGSEATKNAVISEVGRNGFKKSLRHENFVPDVAIVDPLLTVTCPPEVTAASGMDCFTQLTEAYLSTKGGNFTDALALEGIKAVKMYLLRVYHNGDDVEARTGMSFAALTSGICLANAGLGAVHGFASAIGALYSVPHGVVCGTIMEKANEVNIRALRESGHGSDALFKYARLGELFLEEKNKPDDYYIDGFVKLLHELTEKLKMPLLRKYGVEVSDVETICAGTDIKNNPVKLTREQLKEILVSRI